MARACPFCGEVFVKLSDKPFTGNENAAQWYELRSWRVEDYVAKSGNHCKRISYYVNNGTQKFYEFFVYANPYARRKYEERLEILDRKPFAIYGTTDKMLIKIDRFEFEG
jgi:hypothetical protein